MPLTAGRLFLRVTFLGFLISTLDLHLKQYACAILSHLLRDTWDIPYSDRVRDVKQWMVGVGVPAGQGLGVLRSHQGLAEVMRTAYLVGLTSESSQVFSTV